MYIIHYDRHEMQSKSTIHVKSFHIFSNDKYGWVSPPASNIRGVFGLARLHCLNHRYEIVVIQTLLREKAYAVAFRAE